VFAFSRFDTLGRLVFSARFWFVVLAFFSISCEKMKELTTSSSSPSPECITLQSEIAGLDKEIDLRLDERNTIRWRGQAFGIMGTALAKRMRDDEEKIIKCRAKREELAVHASFLLSCPTRADNWEKTIARDDCTRGVRTVKSAKYPEGWGLNWSGCLK
jgi:hypothetical protein